MSMSIGSMLERARQEERLGELHLACSRRWFELVNERHKEIALLNRGGKK